MRNFQKTIQKTSQNNKLQGNNIFSQNIAPVTLAVTLALSPLAAQAYQPQGQDNSQAEQHLVLTQYNIATGSLAQVLTTFSQQAGVALVVDANKVNGLHSTGLQGKYTIEQGFSILLQHTEFTVKKNRFWLYFS